MNAFKVVALFLSLILTYTLSQLTDGSKIQHEPDFLNKMRRFGTFDFGLTKQIAEHYAYRQKLREEFSALKVSLKNRESMREQMRKQKAIQKYIDANRLGGRQFLRDFHTNRF